jgi:hypothetical protein
LHPGLVFPACHMFGCRATGTTYEKLTACLLFLSFLSKTGVNP